MTPPQSADARIDTRRPGVIVKPVGCSVLSLPENQAMRYALPVLFVLAAALPALGEEATSTTRSFVPVELMTNAETPVHAEADEESAVVGTVPESVRLVADDQDGFWYHITYGAGGERVSGWVFGTDVDNLMGRSKGQLLAESRRLYDEVVELRKQVQRLEAQLEEAREEAKGLEEQLAEIEEERDQLADELKAAQDGEPEATAPEPATTEPAAAEPEATEPADLEPEDAAEETE